MTLLIECSVRAVLLAAAVAVILYGLRIHNAHTQHSAWCAVLVAMLLLPAFCVWGPKATLRVLPYESELPNAIAELKVDTSPPVPSRATAINSPSEPEPLPRQPRPEAPSITLMLYLLVAAALLVRFILGSIRAASIRRHARPEGEFLSSPVCACPVMAVMK